MGFLFSRRRRVPFYPTMISLVVITFLFLQQMSKYDEKSLIESFMSAYHHGSNSFWFNKKTQITKNQIIFPYKFKISEEDLPLFVESKTDIFNMTELKRPEVVKSTFSEEEQQKWLRASPLTAKTLKASNYVSHNITVFHSSKNIKNDLKKCNKIERNFTRVEIDQPVSMQVSLSEVLSSILEDYKAAKTPYIQELGPFFAAELELQLKYNVVDKFWYRLAGSSVWLEQYGVHFMISRILYSPKGARNQPILSLTYAQIFDKDWKELVNTKLVVPTNDPNPSMEDIETQQNTKGKNYIKVLSFPYVLPIPFWHDYDNTDGKYYGPEDPRILLVKNPKGYEEPLIIFNSYHRKLNHFDDDTDDHVLMKANFYRSMFMCWPWQFQKGKENTDGSELTEYSNRYYNKVIELRIKNLPRHEKQKNWTPFISHSARVDGKYDRYINFIYRWANLEILKCDLIGDSGLCAFTYRLNDRLKPTAQVGPLRGGTQLMNLNELLLSSKEVSPIKELLPPNREIWLGFARAHLDKCGCGNNMYRPNLVVIVKDSVEVENDDYYEDAPRTRMKDMYRITHVSSSISFDIPIIGWDLMNPKDVCTGSNVLIPNGISHWTINSFEKDFHWKAEDYMTLSLSISDFTVHKITIRGLLNELLQDKSLFMAPTPEGSRIKVDAKTLNIPDARIVSDPAFDDSKRLTGFNNDNVLCGLQKSADFCYVYGVNQALVYESNEQLYDDLESSLQHAKVAHHVGNEIEELFYEEENDEEEIITDINKYEKALELQNIQDSVKNYPSRPDRIAPKKSSQKKKNPPKPAEQKKKPADKDKKNGNVKQNSAKDSNLKARKTPSD